MRSACALVVLAMLTACANQPALIPSTLCTEPRPLLCTMEFNPTCAVLTAGGTKEFASPCTACADPAVSGYVAGPCQ